MKNPAMPNTLYPGNTANGSASKSRMGYWFYATSARLASTFSAVLITITTCAHGQTVGQVAAGEGSPPNVSPASSSPTSPAAPSADAAPRAPKYNSSDIARAFTFMDANRDGQISRAEASGFRNVAKHFDAADTDKNDSLSLQEFGDALNRP